MWPFYIVYVNWFQLYLFRLWSVNNKLFRWFRVNCVKFQNKHPLTPAWSFLRKSLQKMKLHHSRMLQDLSRKRDALALEQRSMSTRRSLDSARPPHRTSGILLAQATSSGRNDLPPLAQ